MSKIKIQSAAGLLLALMMAYGMFYSLRGHRPEQAFRYICQTVYDKHYYGHSALSDWYKKCLSAAARIPATATPEVVIEQAKFELANIVTSHLDVYSPSEDQAVWKGHEEFDSGMRARAMDGRYLVSRVYAEGAAAAAGVRLGDEILKLAGVGLLSADAIQVASGEVEMRRWVSVGGGAHEVLLTVNITSKALQIDQGPEVRRLASDVGLLEISSFRQEYFHKEEWLKVVDQFQDFPSLVVDVRGNLGGDFVALLRGLSVFLCKPKSVGDLVRPQAKPNADGTGARATIEDGVSSEALYDLLGAHQRLQLRTFSGYPCYSGAVTVLADGDSASVAEIFALAMSERAQTRVWGERTRGDMLLGVWYPLALLGKGYTMSVPEALYVSPKNEMIEGHGVKPARDLYYRLEDARRGEDTWLKAALANY